jgi:hypothetical protein
MPVFQLKARTAETYLAGIGASGALMASAFVMFVILIGVVTFDAWPHGGLFGGGDGDVSLNSTTASPAAAAVAGTPNLAKLLNHKAPSVTAQAASPPHRVSHPSVISQGKLESGTNNSSGGSAGGQAPVGTTEPPPPVTGGTSNVVNRTVSTVGNTVEGTTTILGDNLGGSSGSGLGGVVGNLGQTVNGALQGLVGNH